MIKFKWITSMGGNLYWGSVNPEERHWGLQHAIIISKLVILRDKMFNKISLPSIFIILIVIICTCTSFCDANSGRPPSLKIIVPNAPSDLQITFGPNNVVPTQRTPKGTAIHFAFYQLNLASSDNILHITTGGRTEDITIPGPLESYSNVFTLNIEKNTLIPGTLLPQAIGSTLAGVLLTLFLEAIVFFLFGFSQRRSWLVFLAANLLTQVVLNIILIYNYVHLKGYLVSSLFFGEILVFVIEILIFALLTKEHTRLRTVLYVVTANLVSLASGIYLLSLLPT
jgi:hypothetical protein